nr:MAG TPA: hypothetical protein [Caudoviricetes sp.]
MLSSIIKSPRCYYDIILTQLLHRNENGGIMMS